MISTQAVMEAETPRLDNQLCFLLYTTSREVTRLYQPVLKALDLTYPQYLVMLVLWEHSTPLSVSEIGKRLHLDSGTLTPLLKRLEQKAIITRRRNDKDERQVDIQLQSKGLEMKRQAAEVPGTLLCRFDANQLRQLQELREELASVLNLLTGTQGETCNDQ